MKKIYAVCQDQQKALLWLGLCLIGTASVFFIVGFFLLLLQDVGDLKIKASVAVLGTSLFVYTLAFLSDIRKSILSYRVGPKGFAFIKSHGVKEISWDNIKVIKDKYNKGAVEVTDRDEQVYQLYFLTISTFGQFVMNLSEVIPHRLLEIDKRTFLPAAFPFSHKDMGLIVVSFLSLLVFSLLWLEYFSIWYVFGLIIVSALYMHTIIHQWFSVRNVRIESTGLCLVKIRGEFWIEYSSLSKVTFSNYNINIEQKNGRKIPLPVFKEGNIALYVHLLLQQKIYN